MILRERHLEQIDLSFEVHPIVAVLGARQVGKTTLARQYAEARGLGSTRFDLEDPDDLARLEEPKIALERLSGLVVIDEVQLRPDLFPILRVLVDRPECEARFLILGSASPALLRQGSETLAGRIGFLYLDGFTLDEVADDRPDRLWLRGGFPPSFLAPSERASVEWRSAFVRTYLERDLPQLGMGIPAQTLHRFWSMLAHYHGQLWNGAELARAFGVSASVVRRYLDLLTGTFVIRQLLPWHENLKKRQVRSPKVYLADTGLLHSLLRIGTYEDLQRHPKVGASWEWFVIREVLRRLGAKDGESWFWATHSGAELDLLVIRGSLRWGFEIKRTTSPRRTRSLFMARESLRLEHIDVVHAGEHTFDLGGGIRALSFRRLEEDLEPLGS